MSEKILRKIEQIAKEALALDRHSMPTDGDSDSFYATEYGSSLREILDLVEDESYDDSCPDGQYREANDCSRVRVCGYQVCTDCEELWGDESPEEE